MYSIMSFANSDSFTSPFLMWIPFISVSFLITVARTSKTMFSQSGKSGHYQLAPDPRLSLFSFSLLTMMFAMVLSLLLFSHQVMSYSFGTT